MEDCSNQMLNCSEFICPCCPHPSIDDCQHTSTDEVLKKLTSLMLDEDCGMLINRHLTLINHFLGISNGRIKMKDVQHITLILGFLCEFLDEIPQYKNALWCLLRLCLRPPLLTSRREALDAEGRLVDYFTSLGNCMLVVCDPEIKTLIIEVLHNLVGLRDENDVPYDLCVRALIKSQMGEKLSQMILVMEDEFYTSVLDLTLKYTALSQGCAEILLERNTIFWLLRRIELKTFTNNSVPSYISEMTSSIIWRLLSTVGSAKSSQSLEFQEEILMILRNWLRKEVLYGDPQNRNDVTAIIGKIIFIYSSENVLKSGIFDDICLLAFSSEFEIKYSWAKNIQFFPTAENLKFKQMLILIICAMFMHPGVRMVADAYNVLPGLSQLLSDQTSKVEWPSEFRCQLILYVLHVIPVVSKYFPDKYIANGFTQNILNIIKMPACLPQYSELLKCSLHCLNSLVMKEISSQHFCNFETVPIVLGLIHRLLKKPLSLINQLLLSHCFTLVSKLSKTSLPKSSNFDRISSIAIDVIGRMKDPQQMDFKLDGSFQVTAIDFIWNTIVKNVAIRRKFVDAGGIYLLLDLAQQVSMPVQALLLGVLADLSTDSLMIPQIVTWRGQESGKHTILALLCSIWRKQEAQKGVTRDSNGCINDSDFILEGKAQASLKASWQYCPAVTEMSGCVRPKVYAVFYNILRRHLKTSDAARKSYGINFQNISANDEITLRIINAYEHFKKGEVWKNLWYGHTNMGMMLLPQIETTLHTLSRTYLYTAANIAREQQCVRTDDVKTELGKEKALYNKLKSCLLTEALENFMTVKTDLYNNSRDHMYKAKKRIETIFIDERLRYDTEGLVPHYHKTNAYNITLSKVQAPKFHRVRMNSKILKPNQYLNKKGQQDNSLLTYTISENNV